MTWSTYPIDVKIQVAWKQNFPLKCLKPVRWKSDGLQYLYTQFLLTGQNKEINRIKIPTNKRYSADLI